MVCGFDKGQYCCKVIGRIDKFGTGRLPGVGTLAGLLKGNTGLLEGMHGGAVAAAAVDETVMVGFSTSGRLRCRTIST